MKNIYNIAKYTFLEVYKSKLFMGIIILSLLTLLISYVSSEFAYGAAARVSLDFTFGILSISNLIISIFLGANLISKEIENKTIYMVLSRSISRKEYMLGKLIGLALVLLGNTIIQGTLGKMLYLALNGSENNLFYWAIVFTFFESIVMLLISVFLSLITNVVLTSFISIVVFVSSYALTDTINSVFVRNNKILKHVLNISQVILPDLNRINLKDHLLYKQNLSLDFLISNFVYLFLYLGFLLICLIVIFEKKSLE